MSSSPGEHADRVFIIDTSAIVEVRRLLSQERQTELKRVFRALAVLVARGFLRFPVEVHGELARGHESLGDADDEPFDWVESVRADAVPDIPIFDHVREVLRVAPTLVDTENPTPREEADAYVVALAMATREQGLRVTVISEDRKDSDFKTSIQSACGLMDLPAMSMRAFLRHVGIRPRDDARWNSIVGSR